MVTISGLEHYDRHYIIYCRVYVLYIIMYLSLGQLLIEPFQCKFFKPIITRGE